MSEAMNQLAAQVDFEMGRKDFKYFFEEICGKFDEKFPGFSPSSIKNGLTCPKATTKPVSLPVVIMASPCFTVCIFYGKWLTIQAQKFCSFHTVSTSPLNTWAK